MQRGDDFDVLKFVTILLFSNITLPSFCKVVWIIADGGQFKEDLSLKSLSEFLD